jgi:hypothetical protein
MILGVPAFSVPSLFPHNELYVCSLEILVHAVGFFLCYSFQAMVCSSNDFNRMITLLSHNDIFAGSMTQESSQEKK